MKAKPGRNKGDGLVKYARASARKRSTQLLPALIVGSACGLVSGPASALQLGELEVESSLGQPLRASIAFALSPNEQLQNYCVRLKPGLAANGLPALTRANVSIANGRINLTSSQPIGDLMLAVQVAVDCPYTMNLTRSYTIMLDPIQRTALDIAVATERTSDVPVAQPAVSRRSPVVRSSAPIIDTAPIIPGTTYTVQVGDTLSDIATRIESRPIGLWPAVNVLFAENPNAFLDGDINQLVAGSQITISTFDDVAAPEMAANALDTSPVSAPSESLSSTGYASFVPDEQILTDDSASLSPAEFVGLEPVSELTSPAETESVIAANDTAEPTSLANIQPGDIAFGGDTAFVSPIESPVISPQEVPFESGAQQDSPIVEAPAASSRPAPVVPVVSSRSATAANGTTSNSWPWLFWLAGSGIALALGLIIFGRKIRDRFGSTPIAPAVERVQPDLDETARNEAIGDVDFQFDDEQQSEQEYTLDADLGAGTGLDDNSGVDVAHDYGFLQTQAPAEDLDMVLPEEPKQQPESAPTDVLPPQNIEKSSILDVEVLPDDDDYDMSMIVDVTKQNIGDTNTTEKDLMAVPINSLSSEKDSDEYTLNEPLGIESLEQDYEDEFTATQAANQEIEKAAQELALRIDEPDGDKTEEMPVSDPVSEATSELTAQMPAVSDADNEEFSDLADTGINEELTAKLPAAENDETVEMDVESARINTKKTTG